MGETKSGGLVEIITGSYFQFLTFSKNRAYTSGLYPENAFPQALQVILILWKVQEMEEAQACPTRTQVPDCSATC